MSHRSWLHAVALVGPALLAACLRPGEDRARRDEQVGRAQVAGVRVEVELGHAAVRELAPDRVRLWAGAPRLALTLEWDAPVPAEVVIEVQNCMPLAELSSADAPLIASERARA